MLALMVFAMAVLAAAAFAVWPSFTTADKAAGETRDAVAGDVATAQKPTTLEGAVAAQLLHGEISPQQYRAALELLAARDDQAHPLSVPEKGDSSTGF